MTAKNSNDQVFKQALESNASTYKVDLTSEQIERLSHYYDLLNSWNARLHLVAPCSPQEFATRHVLESLLLLCYLPPDAKVADVGSGAGLPIIPCLIVRSDINATLIESSKKKAVFLSEAVHNTETSKGAKVVPERFEAIQGLDAGFVTCRALERFTQKFPALIKWAPTESTLLLFGGVELREKIESARLNFQEIKIPNSQRRFLFRVKRARQE